MKKDSQKLREGLAGLFKERGVVTQPKKYNKDQTQQQTKNQQGVRNAPSYKSPIKNYKPFKEVKKLEEKKAENLNGKPPKKKNNKNKQNSNNLMNGNTTKNSVEFKDTNISKNANNKQPLKQNMNQKSQLKENAIPGPFKSHLNKQNQKNSTNPHKKKKKVKISPKDKKPFPTTSTNLVFGKRKAATPSIGKGPSNKKVRTDNHQLVEVVESEPEYSETNSEFDYEESSETLSHDYSYEGEDFDDEFSYESEDSDTEYSGSEYSFESDDYEDESDETGSSVSFNDNSSYEEYPEECDFNFVESDNDPDYELPKDHPEDLIVHKGLAVTYNLESHHGIDFDEQIEELQIVELPSQESVKAIQQPESYSLEKFREQEELFLKKLANVSKASKNTENDDDDDCPELVAGDDGGDPDFRLWTSGVTMDDQMFSDYEEVEDSEDSVLSYSDVNRKYLQAKDDGWDSSSSDDNPENKSGYSFRDIKAEIVKVENINEKTLLGFLTPENEAFGEEISNLQKLISKTFSSGSRKDNIEIVEAPVMEDFEESLESLSEEEETENSYEQEENLSENEENLMDMEENESGSHSNESYSQLKDVDDNEIPETDQILESNTWTKQASIKSDFYNSSDSFHVLVLVKSKFFVYGTLKVTLIAGSIEIYGYRPKKEETLTVHSPRGCSAVQLEPILNSEDTNSSPKTPEAERRIRATINKFHKEAEFNLKDIKKLLEAFDPNQHAIVLLERNDAAEKVKQMFQQHINENVYPLQIPRSRYLYTSESILDCMINFSEDYALELPPEWSDLSLEKQSKFLLVGGKSVGKSTLLRYLFNRHLPEFQRILLIDLDIGQPEVFISQTVYCTLLDRPLLGPGFFEQLQPDKAFVVGHINVVLCAHTYMNAVLDLLKFCKSEEKYRNVPWLINTMGYNKGFGAELISVICDHLQPTDIIQIQSNMTINNFDVLFASNVIKTIPRAIYGTPDYSDSSKVISIPEHHLHVLSTAIPQQSRYQREWQMSAKDMRYIMLLTRLSELLPDEGEGLNKSETFCCNLNDVKVVNLVSKNASETDTLKALESNLVYLCRVHHNSELNTTANEAQEASIECFGIGIVRGIDYLSKRIFIIPAVPAESLSKVNCLALGEMPLPASLLTQQNPETEFNVPYVQVMDDEVTSRAVKQFYSRTSKTGK